MAKQRRHPLYLEDLEYVSQVKGFDTLFSKSFLITGATGLIGTCLIDSLMLANEKGANIEIYAVGRNRENAFERFGNYFASPHFHFIEQDVRQPLPSYIHVDYILPLASNTHPTAYSQYPIETIEINYKGAEFALKKATDCGATILYPSSVEVYGNARGHDVFTEDYTGELDLSIARSCYTESKRVSEALCQSYMAERGTSLKIARISRVFGPTMLSSDTKASSQFIKKAIQGEDIILKSKGDQFFSYTYVAEVVSALLYILLHGDEGVAYNISNETCNVHLKDFARICAQWSNKQVVFDIPTAVEQKGFSIAMQAILDNSRLKSLGWSSRINIEDAIFRTLAILSAQ